MISFNLRIGTAVRFGPGCRRELSQLLSGSGWRRVGLVVDHNLRNVDGVAALIDGIRTTADHAAVGWCELSEPTYEALDATRGLFMDQGLQAIVGIGGGSALDMAKAMAVLVNNRQPSIEYRGFDRMSEPVLPVVAIPTTAGTGSEVTPNASFIDTLGKKRMGINGEAIKPRFALLDPELTLTCPERASVSAGVDSLVHATEAYVAKKTNPIARLFAREGFGRVFNALPKVLGRPMDLAARAEVMYGAFLAGVALMHSGTGPAAAMSYPLGVHHGVPHGLGGAMFLPGVAGHNVRNGAHDYADLYLTMDGADRALSKESQAAQFVARLVETWAGLRVPASLDEVGVGANDVDRLVEDTLVLEGALQQNPVPFGRSEIRHTFEGRVAPVGS